MVLKNIKQDNEESLVLLMPKIAVPTMFLTTGTYSKLRQNNCLFTEVKATLTFKHQSLLCCFYKERNGEFTQAFLLAFRDMVAKKVNKDNFIHLMTTQLPILYVRVLHSPPWIVFISLYGSW